MIMDRQAHKAIKLLGLIALTAATTILTITSCYDGHGLAPPGTLTGIEGRITFVGAKPDSTKDVWIVVLKQYPAGITNQAELMTFVLQNIVIYKSIPMDGFYDYQLEINPGDYGWVIVAWFADTETWLFSVKELGAYERPGTGQPATINVRPGVMTGGVDIVADFANVKRETPFF
jgi:hypothetical protein